MPIDETLEALTRLVEAGKVRYVGCSNETAYGLTKSLWASDRNGLARYETIQNNFSLLNRRFEDELAEVCRRESVSLLPYSPLAGGVLSRQVPGRRPPAGRALHASTSKRIAAHAGDDPALRQRAHARVDRALHAHRRATPACRSPRWPSPGRWRTTSSARRSSAPPRAEQLTDTLAAAETTLSADVLAACNEVSKEIRYPMG